MKTQTTVWALAFGCVATSGCANARNTTDSRTGLEGLSSREGTDSDVDSDSDSDAVSEVDEGLLLWPQPYQDFIADVGGSKFVDVGGARMHYVDTGPHDGETVLLIHGIPTQAFLWRNVIPQLSDKRVIAVDLVGYGRSDRPDGLPYDAPMQVEFLHSFADALDLEDVHLVTHDLGGPVGLRWAFEDPDRVQSITMFETLWTTLPSLSAIPGPFGELLVALQIPGVGEDLVGPQNVFLAGLTAGLEPQDAAVYEYPWSDPADRIAVFLPSGPRNFPIPSNEAMFTFVAEYQAFLTATSIPKLVLDISPGLLSAVAVEGAGGQTLRLPPFAAETFPNTTLVAIEGSGHYVQEHAPAALGAAINGFIDGLD